MKNMWIMGWVIVVLAVFAPVVAMDSAVRQKLMSDAGVHLDLMDAAKILPSDKDDEKHLCVKELKIASRDFKLEKALYDKDKPGTIPVKKLVTDGERALQGARFLVNNFIAWSVTSKTELEELKKSVEKLEKEKKSAEQASKRFKDDLDKKTQKWAAVEEQLNSDFQFNFNRAESVEAEIKDLRKSRDIRLLLSWLIAPILGGVLLKIYQHYSAA